MILHLFLVVVTLSNNFPIHQNHFCRHLLPATKITIKACNIHIYHIILFNPPYVSNWPFLFFGYELFSFAAFEELVTYLIIIKDKAFGTTVTKEQGYLLILFNKL